MRSTFVIGLFLVWWCIQPLGLSAGAEEHPQESATLTVSASGTINLQPDTAKISLAVETAGTMFEKVQLENRHTMQRVIDSLVTFGIEKARIQTTSFNVTPQYAPRPPRRPTESHSTQPPKIIGYTASNTVMVEVRKLELIGKVVSLALSAGANRVSGINWMLRERHPVYLQALKKASRKAQEKATVLAEALGVTLTHLQFVQEGGRPVQPRMKSYAMSRLAMAESAGDSVPLSPGEIQVQAAVSLVYEIEPKSNE